MLERNHRRLVFGCKLSVRLLVSGYISGPTPQRWGSQCNVVRRGTQAQLSPSVAAQSARSPSKRRPLAPPSSGARSHPAPPPQSHPSSGNTPAAVASEGVARPVSGPNLIQQQRGPPLLSRNVPAPPPPGSRPWLTLGSTPASLPLSSPAQVGFNFGPVSGDPGLITRVQTLAERLEESAQRLLPNGTAAAGGEAFTRSGGSVGGVAMPGAQSIPPVPMSQHVYQQVAQQLQIMQMGPLPLGLPYSATPQLPPGSSGRDSPPIPVPLMKKKRT